MARDEQCVAIGDDESGKQPKERYYATAFRGRQGDSRNKVMSLLWAQEREYWKIIAIRIDDSSDAGIVPKSTAAQVEPTEQELHNIAGDPAAVKDITQFYLTWILKRDATQASHFVSERSYQCLTAPPGAQKKLTSLTGIQSALKRPLEKIPSGTHLAEMMSSVQPVNDLVFAQSSKKTRRLSQSWLSQTRRPIAFCTKIATYLMNFLSQNQPMQNTEHITCLPVA
jgi:hypothetical protein